MTSADLNCVSIKEFGIADWGGRAFGTTDDPVATLERGDVVFLPHLGFQPYNRERALFSPDISGSSKNIAFDPATSRLAGSAATGEERSALADMLARFSTDAASLVDHLLPAYGGRIARGRASFRPVEIADRETSWRKDDTRLHIDAFPATPVHGRRILRVFSNVNPAGRPRTWRVGEPFEAIAERFGAALRPPLGAVTTALHWLRITKSRRTAYDALMLQLHDRMKADDEYQRACAQQTIDFPAGSTWIAFTDQVSHAAMAGQYQLEQTFMVPVEAMQDASRSPLRILEKIKGRRLV